MYKDGFKKLLKSNQNIKVKKYKGFLYELDISFIFYYHFVKKMPLKCIFGYQKLIIMKGILTHNMLFKQPIAALPSSFHLRLI